MGLGNPLLTTDAAPLRHLYEDDRLLVIDKPAGLLVHRTALDAHESDTVHARLLHETGLRFYPVHRLDKGTSGALVLARDAEAARLLGSAFESGAVTKHYVALLRGWPDAEGLIDHPLARDPERPSAGQPTRPARTRWSTRTRLEWPFAVDARHPSSRYALVDIHPETGRRHQIRRHFKHIGHPLIGDSTHGKGAHNRAVAAWLGAARLWLHASSITLAHPSDGAPLTVQSALGSEWLALEPGALSCDGMLRAACYGASPLPTPLPL